jgi:squalene cyclase
VETLYLKGLDWLLKNQAEDGSYPGQYGTEPAVVAFAVLSILAHGQDANAGPFAKNIAKGIEYILSKQEASNGYIGSSMYNHGFATLALAEAYGAVPNEKIGPALKKAVELILSSQKNNRFKAWRYSPESSDADTTVSGACFVALIAARNAGLAVPDQAIEDALKFYSDCQTPEGVFAYVPRSGGSVGPTTAIGVAAYAYAREKKAPEYEKGMKALEGASGDQFSSYPFYFEYYMAQALFQSDVQNWEKWNNRHVRNLLDSQSDDGSWNGGLGPATCTGLALLSIALNYRYLPIYER